MIWLERRWVQDVLSGFAGESERQDDDTDDMLAPEQGEVDYVEAYRGMLQNGSFLAGLGMRLALAFCLLSPIWLLHRPRRFGSLSGPDRAALLDRLLHHRIYMVAELTLLMKLCACMALFRSATVRERSRYDSPRSDEDEVSDEVLESGTRSKTSLPVLAEQAGEEVA